jgi:hypothetical protein
VLVTKALRFAEPDAIDDAGVIQFIADHRVFVGEQRLEQAAVCIETGWIKNRIFGAEELAKRCFEFLVNVLCATNETHTRHPKPVRLESLFGRSDQRGMIGEPQIIVCTHVEHAFAARDRNVRVLRTGDDTLGFEKTLRLNFFESLSDLIFEFSYHGVHRLHRFRLRGKETQSRRMEPLGSERHGRVARRVSERGFASHYADK